MKIVYVCVCVCMHICSHLTMYMLVIAKKFLLVHCTFGRVAGWKSSLGILHHGRKKSDVLMEDLKPVFLSFNSEVIFGVLFTHIMITW